MRQVLMYKWDVVKALEHVQNEGVTRCVYLQQLSQNTIQCMHI